MNSWQAGLFFTMVVLCGLMATGMGVRYGYRHFVVRGRRWNLAGWMWIHFILAGILYIATWWPTNRLGEPGCPRGIPGIPCLITTAASWIVFVNQHYLVVLTWRSTVVALNLRGANAVYYITPLSWTLCIANAVFACIFATSGGDETATTVLGAVLFLLIFGCITSAMGYGKYLLRAIGQGTSDIHKRVQGSVRFFVRCWSFLVVPLFLCWTIPVAVSFDGPNQYLVLCVDAIGVIAYEVFLLAFAMRVTASTKNKVTQKEGQCVQR